MSPTNSGRRTENFMAAGIATRARNNKANAINSQNTLKIGTEEGEVAVLTGQVRRVLSLEGVKGSARCLLDRLRGLGAGAAATARRRAWAEAEEQRLRRERQAHILSLGQGQHALRRG